LSGKKKQAASQERARAEIVIEKQTMEWTAFEYGRTKGRNNEGKLKFWREGEWGVGGRE
jgi:hypothetical protein